MKKLILFTLALSLLTLAFVGCSTAPAHFSGEWHFSRIADITLSSDVDAEMLEGLKEGYGAADKEGVLTAARAAFDADKTFTPCYVNFTKDRTYTYDPIAVREATWVFYQTAENEGFLSFYAEIDPSEVTPDPAVFPPVVYNPESNTLTLTIKYSAFVVAVELTK